jgi:hypothetical protein
MTGQWDVDDLELTYEWVTHLPANDQREFLQEVNAYLVANHGYDEEWDRLITQWRKTAEYWHDHPDEAQALVEVIGVTDRCMYCHLPIKQGDGETAMWYTENNSVNCVARWFPDSLHIPESDTHTRVEVLLTGEDPPSNTPDYHYMPLTALFGEPGYRLTYSVETPEPPKGDPVWRRVQREFTRSQPLAGWAGLLAYTVVVWVGALVNGINSPMADVWITMGIAFGAYLAVMSAVSFGTGFIKGFKKAWKGRKADGGS